MQRLDVFLKLFGYNKNINTIRIIETYKLYKLHYNHERLQYCEFGFFRIKITDQ